jgi:hypothetical protein
MAVVVQIGPSYLGESPAPQAHWVENPGDCAVFVDASAANTYAAARNVTFSVTQPVVSGKRNPSKRENNG